MLCILYVTTIALLLGTFGVLAERLLPAWFSRRWIWFATLSTSVVLPGYYRFHHVMMLDGTTFGAITAADAGLLRRFNAFGASISSGGLVVSVLLVLWAIFNAAWISRRLRGTQVSQRVASTAVDG